MSSAVNEIKRTSKAHQKRKIYWLWRRLRGGATVFRLSTWMYMHRRAQTEWLLKGVPHQSQLNLIEKRTSKEITLPGPIPPDYDIMFR